MKKLCLLGCFLLGALAAGAQDFGVWNPFHAENGRKPSSLIHAIERVFVRQQHAGKVPWVKVLEAQTNAAIPRGLLGKNTWDHVLPVANGPVPPTETAVYNQRTQAWQRALQANPAVRHFHLKTPQAEVIAELSQAQADYITAFLKAPVTMDAQDSRFVPQHVTPYQKFLVGITLKPATDEAPVYLVFNAYAKEMYVASPRLAIPGISFEKLAPSRRSFYLQSKTLPRRKSTD